MEFFLATFLIGLSVGFILVYVFFCYVNYRIIRKFDPDMTFPQNLIPFWNTYLLAKQVTPHAAIIVITVFLCGFFAGAFDHSMYTLALLLRLASLSLWAWVIGLVAQTLGKNFWLYAILALFSLPLLIIMPLMAFDDSRPVNKSA